MFYLVVFLALGVVGLVLFVLRLVIGTGFWLTEFVDFRCYCLGLSCCCLNCGTCRLQFGLRLAWLVVWAVAVIVIAVLASCIYWWF